MTPQEQINKFNAAAPPGTVVKVIMMAGIKISRIRFPATILGGHTPVGWVDGISGCYDLRCILPCSICNLICPFPQMGCAWQKEVWNQDWH